MLPILNVQAVFRWSLRKYVLNRRGLIKCGLQRASGLLLDAADTSDVTDFLRDIDDLQIPQQVLSTIGGEGDGVALVRSGGCYFVPPGGQHYEKAMEDTLVLVTSPDP